MMWEKKKHPEASSLVTQIRKSWVWFMVINDRDPSSVRTRDRDSDASRAINLALTCTTSETRQSLFRALQEGSQQLSGSSSWTLTQVPFAAMAARSPSVEVETAGHHPLHYNSSREEMKHPKSASKPAQL